MTVAANTPYNQYTAILNQTLFNYVFEIVSQTDLLVYQRASTDAPDDVLQLLILNTDYTVTGVGNTNGGTIILNVPAVAGDIISIRQNIPVQRDTSFTNGGILRAQDLNAEFDYQVMIEQNTRFGEQKRSINYQNSAVVIVGRDTIIPVLEPQQVFRMNDAGTGFEGYTIDGTPAPSSSPYLTYANDPTLEQAQNLALLGDGLLKQSVSAGIATLALAIPGTDYLDPGVPLGTMAFQNANNVLISGGSAALTAGSVVNSPTAGTDLVNKSYADSIAAGFTFKASCVVATTSTLNTTYNNAAAGVGATLTSNVNGALSIDGYSPLLNDRILVKNQSTTFQNGVYTASDLGSAGSPFILTRATDFDTPAEIQPGAIIFIQEGVTQNDTSFVQTEIVFAVGTSPILFTQFSQQYPLSWGNGGTGSSIMPIPNAVLITNGSSVGQLSTTLPSGLTIPGYATSGANSNITSLTGLTGNIQAPTAIASTTGLNILGFSYTVASVNYFQMTNSITGVAPILEVAGTDPNIAMNIKSKGLSGIGLHTTALTRPLTIFNGTTEQHATTFNMENTAASRQVTFQDSDGTIAWLTDIGWTKIGSTLTFNNTAVAAEFINLTRYQNYCLVLNCVAPEINGGIIAIQASTNNGVSYLGTSGDYFYQAIACTGTTVSTGGSSTGTFIPITSSGVGSAAQGGVSDFIYLSGLNQNTLRKGFSHTGMNFNSSSAIQYYAANGQIVTTSIINAIRLSSTSGNLFSGTATLYGIK